MSTELNLFRRCSVRFGQVWTESGQVWPASAISGRMRPAAMDEVSSASKPTAFSRAFCVNAQARHPPHMAKTLAPMRARARNRHSQCQAAATACGSLTGFMRRSMTRFARCFSTASRKGGSRVACARESAPKAPQRRLRRRLDTGARLQNTTNSRACSMRAHKSSRGQHETQQRALIPLFFFPQTQ